MLSDNDRPVFITVAGIHEILVVQIRVEIGLGAVLQLFLLGRLGSFGSSPGRKFGILQILIGLKLRHGIDTSLHTMQIEQTGAPRKHRIQVIAATSRLFRIQDKRDRIVVVAFDSRSTGRCREANPARRGRRPERPRFPALLFLQAFSSRIAGFIQCRFQLFELTHIGDVPTRRTNTQFQGIIRILTPFQRSLPAITAAQHLTAHAIHIAFRIARHRAVGNGIDKTQRFHEPGQIADFLDGIDLLVTRVHNGRCTGNQLAPIHRGASRAAFRIFRRRTRAFITGRKT